MIAELAERDDPSLGDVVNGAFPVDGQLAICHEVIETFGMRPDTWRLDPTVHPFASGGGVDDIRLTTNYKPNGLESFFAAMHEYGHGEDRSNAFRFPHRALGFRCCAHELSEYFTAPEQIDEPSECRGVGMQVIVRIVEDLTDARSIPLGSQVHPQASLRIPHVLEEVCAIGARGGAEVREHLS